MSNDQTIENEWNKLCNDASDYNSIKHMKKVFENLPEGNQDNIIMTLFF